MGIQKEQAEIELKINNIAAARSLNEMDQQIKSLTKTITGMHNADKPELYQALIEKLNTLKAARAAELDVLNGNVKAIAAHNKELQDEFRNLNNAASGSSGFSTALGTMKAALSALGIAASIGLLISWGKELFALQVKAGGIQNAFSKIGDTTGLIEKLRQSSRGLISDLDLEKIAVKANNANISIARLPELLAFAQQRARDTGQDVTALTEKLITGLGKGGTKSLAALGFSTNEVKIEFKKTGDMVEAVANIIHRRMGDAGRDVDTFGDRVETGQARWQNFLMKASGIFKKIFAPDVADADVIESQKNKLLKQIGDYNAFTDAKLNDQIKKLDSDNARLQIAHDKAKAALTKWKNEPVLERLQSDIFWQDSTKLVDKAKEAAEAKQSNQDALDALLATRDRRVSKKDGEDQKNAPGEKKAENQREIAAAKYKQLQEQLREFNASELADTMARNDKEIQQLENKYNKEIALQNGFLKEKGKTKAQTEAIANTVTQLEADKQKGVIDLRLKQEKELTDKIIQFRETLADKVATELQKETDSINKFYDALKKEAGDNPDQQAEIEVERIKTLGDAKLREAQRLVDATKKINAEATGEDAAAGGDKLEFKLVKIRAAGDKEIEALKKKFSKEIQATKDFQDAVDLINKTTSQKELQAKEDDAKTWKLTAINGAETLANTLFEISNRNSQAEADRHIGTLEKQRTAELNNTSLTEAQKFEINSSFDKQEAEIKKQQFESQRTAAAEQALINGALGVLKLWVDPGFPAAIPLAAALGVATLVQEATILSQPTPAFAKGGIFNGPSHEQGGLNVVDTTTGKTVANVEGDEPWMVLSKETRQNNNALINQLLFNSMYRNGASVDTGGVSKGIQVARSGGVFNNQQPSIASNQSAVNGVQPIANSGHSDRLDRIEQVMHDFISKQATINAIPVTFNNRAYDKQKAKNVQFQDNANA